MVVGVYGGSFNPPHVGHAMVAAWLGWTARVDEVWLVPTWQHAFEKKLAPWDARVAACEALAAAVGPHVRVSTIEAALPSPSYTVQTLDALAAAHPEHRFRLVVGSDVLVQPAWKDWPRIEAHYAPILVGRGGYAPIPGSPSFPEVSSSEIRERLERGEDVGHLVMRGVLDVWPR